MGVDLSKLFIPPDAERQHALLRWAAAQVPWLATPESFGPCVGWGVLGSDDAKAPLVGAIVLNNYRPGIGDIELNVIAQKEGWANREIFRVVSDYVFNQLKCGRISLTLPRGAKKTRDHAVRVGFKMEGVRRKGFYNGADAIIYGMLRSECQFLNERKEAA